MPSRNTIEIVINATDNASRVFNSLSDNSQKLGGIITAGIVGGLAAATVAITGFAVKGIQEFQSFEQGIKEVFTLIPDASEQMKVKLSNDVQYMAERFGILTDKQIPALYQALSAGVPQDNIFQFLEIANKAAVGGVVDLEVAVDGITSVINAYGQDILSAAQASDIMFTGVRLGKTTFNELSQSLFQVIPSASGLGVAFGDVTAALAAITSQGTPTSVATTQLRQLFVELSKAGGKAADTFQELSGKSFKDFIASGNNVQDALILMEQGAKASGLSISDMFSSVEAGNAALQLTGQGAARLTDFLEQMGNSTGAAEKAFETMSDTIEFHSNRVAAQIKNIFINIGKSLEPFVRDVLDVVGTILGVFSSVMDDSFNPDSVVDFVGDTKPALKGLVKTLFDFGYEIKRILSVIKRFFDGVRAGVPFLDNLRAVLYSLFPRDIADAINFIINGINKLWEIIKPVINTIIQFISDNVELKDVLIAVGVVISSFVIPAIISIVAAVAPLIGTFVLLVGAVTLLRKAWENDFLGIRTFVLEKLIPALGQLADWFINTALPAIIDFVQNTAIPGLQRFVNWLSGIWESVKPHLENLANWFIHDALPAVIDFITNKFIPTIGMFITNLVNVWNFVKPHLERLYDWFVTEALPAVIRFIEGTVIPGITKLRDFISQIWEFVRPELEKFYNWFVTEALPQILNFINTSIIPGIEGFRDLIADIWEFVSPALSSFFDWFAVNGLPAIRDFIQNTFITPFTTLRDLVKNIWSVVRTPLNNFKNGIENIFNWIKTNVIDPIIGRIQEFIKTLQDLGIIQGNVQSQVTSAQALAGVTTNPASAVTNTSGLFGYANGLPFAARRMPIMIDQGERVLTKQENRDYTANQGNNSPSVVIENVNIGSINNQDDANRKAEMFVNGLRLQGIEI